MRTDARFDMLEAGLGQVPEQGERTLTHLGHFVLHGSRGGGKVSAAVSSDRQRAARRRRPYLHALVHQGEDVAAGDQLLDGAAQAFGQAAEEIQGHDHEIFVRGFVLVRLRLVKL